MEIRLANEGQEIFIFLIKNFLFIYVQDWKRGKESNATCFTLQMIMMIVIGPGGIMMWEPTLSISPGFRSPLTRAHTAAFWVHTSRKPESTASGGPRASTGSWQSMGTLDHHQEAGSTVNGDPRASTESWGQLPRGSLENQ